MSGLPVSLRWGRLNVGHRLTKGISPPSRPTTSRVTNKALRCISYARWAAATPAQAALEP
jgi:hypothetical protein